MPPWPPSSRGLRKYDLVAPICESSPLETQAFGEAIIRNILAKGYCVVQLPVPEETLEQVLHEIAVLEEDGLFSVPPGEVVDGLLGEEGSLRIAELPEASPEAAEADEENLLPNLDAHFSSVADVLAPMAAEAFGFELQTRTVALLHQSGTPREPFPYISHACALEWLQTFNLHRIMCIAFLGPDCGTLEMQPFDDESHHHEVDTEPGMCIYLRADLLSHSYRSPEESYAITCWLLQAQRGAPMQLSRSFFPMTPVSRALEDVLQLPPEVVPGEEIPRHTQRMLHHMHQTGGKTAVWGLACLLPLPANYDFWSSWSDFSGGFDAAEPMDRALARWESLDYYDPEPKNGKIPCRHMACVEGLELFDNRFFRISPLEARTIAPEQRKTLEVGYEVMYYAGFKKQTMEKTATAVFVGAQWNEWNLVRPMDSAEQGGFGATSNMNPINANRLSYILGFNGPSMALDTEGSSSLVAVCRGVDHVTLAKDRRTVDQSLCMGVSFLLSPAFLLMPARGGYLSRSGRCRTFDANAHG